MTEFLLDGSPDAARTILLFPGAGAGPASPRMAALAAALAAAGFRVARRDFAFRTGESRRPPPRAERLIPEVHAAISALAAVRPVIIGGKSMGGRVASMAADEAFAAGRVAGCLCIGYPFHPPKKPASLRTVHLETQRAPTLICQGTRDPFGTLEEVPTYRLSPAVEVAWFEDGDHDLVPRKGVTGLSPDDHLRALAAAVAAWVARLP